MVVWKDVVGYEGLYKVSDSGEIYSAAKGNKLKPSLSDGYLRVKLCKNGVKSNLRVHRLVAEAFLDAPSTALVEHCKLVEPDGRVLVRHVDNIKTNNGVSNLSWGSSQDNADDFKQSSSYEPWKAKKIVQRLKSKGRFS